MLAEIGSITPGNRPSGSSPISQPGAPEPLGKPGCVPQGIWEGLALLLVLVTPWQEKCLVPHVQTFPEWMRQSYGRCQSSREMCVCVCVSVPGASSPASVGHNTCSSHLRWSCPGWSPGQQAGVGKRLLGLMVVPNLFPLSFLHLSRVRRVYWWGQRPIRYHC